MGSTDPPGSRALRVRSSLPFAIASSRPRARCPFYSALLEGDRAAFEQHLSSMDRFFRSTKNPALIAQCEKLRRTAISLPRRAVGLGHADTSSQAQVALARCHGREERQRCALQLVLETTGAAEAYFFSRGQGATPLLACQLASRDPPAELVERVAEIFLAYLHEAEETARDSVSLGTPTLTAPPDALCQELLPLVVKRSDRYDLVGVIAVLMRGPMGGEPHSLLDDLALQLFEASDLEARTLV